MKRQAIFLSALLAVLIFTAPALAQIGTIRGEIKDEEGNPLQAVLIKIQGLEVKRNYEVKTGKDGKYFHGGVSLQGTYRVVAEKEGYASDYVEGVRPAFGQTDDRDPRGVANFTLRKGKAGPLAFELTDEQREKLRKEREESQKQQQLSAEIAKLFNLGLELAQQGQYEQAIATYKQALEKVPQQPYIWANLGSAHARLKQYDQAIEAFNKAIENKPDDSALYQNLGNIYAEMGNIEKAKETFEKAAGLAALANPKEAAVNYYNMGVTFINSGRTREAEEALKKAVGADPAHAEAHYQLGIVLLGLNKIAESVTYLKKYLEVAPNGPNAEVAKALVQELGQ